jgi:hypothetical protein
MVRRALMGKHLYFWCVHVVVSLLIRDGGWGIVGPRRIWIGDCSDFGELLLLGFGFGINRGLGTDTSRSTVFDTFGHSDARSGPNRRPSKELTNQWYRNSGQSFWVLALLYDLLLQ